MGGADASDFTALQGSHRELTETCQGLNTMVAELSDELRNSQNAGALAALRRKHVEDLEAMRERFEAEKRLLLTSAGGELGAWWVTCAPHSVVCD